MVAKKDSSWGLQGKKLWVCTKYEGGSQSVRVCFVCKDCLVCGHYRLDFWQIVEKEQLKYSLSKHGCTCKKVVVCWGTFNTDIRPFL